LVNSLLAAGTYTVIAVTFFHMQAQLLAVAIGTGLATATLTGILKYNLKSN
jgi:hypothetical protein